MKHGMKRNNTDGRRGDFKVSEEGGRSSRQDEKAEEAAHNQAAHNQADFRPQAAADGHGGAAPITPQDAKRHRRRESPERGSEGSRRGKKQAQDESLGRAAVGSAKVRMVYVRRTRCDVI